ncbi:MAG: SPFH domain-containing protein [Lachnospiraceae bacterium]|nr:SPFH domain-containing protein [Lachnospiraceae bacterium]
MGLFSNQFSNVVEWNEGREGVLFYKWQNQEIKKGSRLIIRPGQDAIFLYNGVVEGIFEDEGSYDIESDIIPFLTTLKSFKFGFNTPLRAEVLFINTKELLVKWGTKNAINLPAQGLPGGMPIRAFGTFNCKIVEHQVVIDKLAGIRQTYTVDDVKERIVASLDQLLMSWIAKEGRDMFNLQADARNIAKGIESDLDMDMRKLGIGITDFKIESFSYPEEIKRMQEKAAAQSMVGDMNRYTQMAAADGMGKGHTGGGIASDMVNLQMGMALGRQMVDQMNQNQNPGMPNMAADAAANTGGAAAGPKFCPDCGTPTSGTKFCGNCGRQLLS